jgi:hypothetical protein
MRLIRFVLTACALLTAGAVQASPFETLDVEAASRWEIKILTEATLAPSASEVFGPAFDVTAPLTPGLEASVTFGQVWAQEGRQASIGFGDVEMAVKAEMARQRADGSGLFLTVEPGLLAPTGAQGLSNDAWRLSLPLVAGRDVGRWSLRAMAAYARNLAGSADREAKLSVLATRKVSDRLRLGGELVWAAAADEGRSLGANLGFSWEAREGVEVQARLGRTLVATADRQPATSLGVFVTKAF